MQKRGQVTIFVILGIVVFIILALLFFGWDKLQEIGSRQINVEKRLETDLNSIDQEIRECIVKESAGFIQKISEHGGYIEPAKSTNYKGKKLAVLCSNIPGKDYCMNSMFTMKDIETRMNNYLTENLKPCLLLRSFENAEKGEFQVNTEISKNNVLITLDYPVKLKENNLEVKETEFKVNLETPFGDALEAVTEIVNLEAAAGEVDTLLFDANSLAKYEVNIYKQYPYRVYDVGFRTEDFHFWFAVEGKTI